nr:ABC transporter substrate-binding protein [Alphaproteobacteria bacterium]
VTKFVKKANVPNEIMNAVLAWKEDNNASSNEAAGYFMATYPKIWRKWVPRKVAKKLEAAL